MVEAVNVSIERKTITPLQNRGPHTSEAEVSAAFKSLGSGDFMDCAIYLGSFDGNAGWERHLKGDELVQVIDGETEFDLITDGIKQTLSLEQNMLLVVPRGCWHRFRSERGVTVLTATPQNDEEHTFVENWRDLPE